MNRILFRIVWSLVFCILLIPAFCQDFRFKKLLVKDGRSTGNVLEVFQDKKGYIWLGTEDGLKKYDGSKLTVYKHNRYDSTSISDDYVNVILEDNHRNLWIGTSRGLNCYNPFTDSFHQFFFNFSDSSYGLSNNIIYLLLDKKGLLWLVTYDGVILFDPTNKTYKKFDIPSDVPGNYIADIHRLYEDNQGLIYIGTRTSGLYCYSPSGKTTTHYRINPDEPPGMSNNFINVILEDSKKNIWLGTMGGLILFDQKRKEFYSFMNYTTKANFRANNHIRSISVTRDDKFWICTNDGLNYGDWNPEKLEMKFTTITHIPGNESSISSNSLTQSIVDLEGRLWLGSRFGGVDIYDTKQKHFENYNWSQTDPHSISFNNVSCFTEDANGYIWVATDGGGLNRFDKKTKSFTHFKNNPDNSNSISDEKVLALCCDSRNMLWIGYWDGGIDCYDIGKNKFNHYSYDESNQFGIINDYVFYLYEDSQHTIWASFWRGGFARYDRERDAFFRCPLNAKDQNELKYVSSSVIIEDKNGIIWVGTESDGLLAYNYKTDHIDQYVRNISDTNSLSHDFITSVFEDSRGILWVGTLGGGLNKYNRESNNFTIYTTIDGLPDNAICGIAEDNFSNLWVSTQHGISRISVDNRGKELHLSFRNYDKNDGLQDDQFNLRAYFRDKSGRMYFGGINGITTFQPENIIDNMKVPTVLITDFYVFNNRITSRNQEISIDKPIDELKEITLSYKHNMITFEFTALNYTDPYKNRYAYMIEGFDKDWIECGNYNKAVYTNLDPGEYVFRVKAANNDGHWNKEGASLKLIITPPFWQTAWFRILAGGAIMLLVLSFYFRRVNLLKRELDKQREYEKVLKLAKENAEESDKLKSSILANISHEIRTPMNAIIGFSDLLVRPEILEDKKKRYIEIIKSRCNDLLFTVESILNVSTIYTGAIKINENVASIDMVFKDIVEKVGKKITEQGKDIKLNVVIPSDQLHLFVRIDVSKLKTILWHLLDNAVKFSESGEIKLGFEVLENKLRFYISDQGIGIPKAKKEIIFEQFRQYDMGITRRYGGMGLGLSLCRGFLEILGGDIWFESVEGKGTTFYFTFPVKFAHPS